MKMAAPPPQERPNTASADRSLAVLYICAARSPDAPGLAGERAAEGGYSFADKHDARIVAEVTDVYGERVPQKRSGWQRVREMVERGEAQRRGDP